MGVIVLCVYCDIILCVHFAKCNRFSQLLRRLFISQTSLTMDIFQALPFPNKASANDARSCWFNFGAASQVTTITATWHKVMWNSMFVQHFQTALVLGIKTQTLDRVCCSFGHMLSHMPLLSHPCLSAIFETFYHFPICFNVEKKRSTFSNYKDVGQDAL